MFAWMCRLFKKFKLETDAQPLPTMNKLEETLEMLEKKEKVLIDKASQELEKAKEFAGVKDKKAAIQCLKRKRLFEQQIERLRNFQLRIHDQMLMLEGAKATTETVDALRTGVAEMKAMQKAKNIEDVGNIMDEIDGENENMKRMQETVSGPSGAAADFDEDELEAELEKLEGTELEGQLVLPRETASAAPFLVPAGLLPAPHVPQGRAREDEPEGTELEEQLLLLAATDPAAPVHVIAGLLPPPPVPQGTYEEDEPTDEMAF